MKKRALIVAIIIVFIAALVWFVTTKQEQRIQPGVTYVTPAPILPSVMPKSLTDKTILYTGEPLLEFPRRVPYVSVLRRRDFEEESARLFALHNITTSPQIITGSRGRMIFASLGGIEGIVTENPLSFSFTVASYSGSFVTGNTTHYQNSAVAALADRSLLPAPFEAALSYVRYFHFNEPHPTEQSVPNGALVAQIDLVATIEGFPVFTGDANTPVFSASFDGSDRLIKLRGVILPDVETSQKDVAVVSYQEALQRLKSGAGVLSSTSLARKTEEGFMTGEIPSNIAIEKAVLGYLYSPHQEYLVPVFVFTGRTAAPQNSQQLITTTVVSAL